jgi:exonuclease SbcC
VKFLAVEIEGFQSFRERQRIELAGINLGVATGENGVGKSTFITDSIALGLYGKARTSTLEEIISTDNLFAQIIIDYEVNGVTYRVDRNIPRNGAQEVRVFVEDATQDTGWRALTERGVREGNQFIITQLGMDYETATTTWLALQGDYGKFSQAKPAERYSTLSGIFDLEQYVPLHEAANSRFKSADSGLVGANARMEEIEKTLAAKPDLTAGEFGALDDAELEASSAAEQVLADGLGRQIAEITVGDPGKIRDELSVNLTRTRTHRQQLLSQAQARVNGLQSQLSRAQQSKSSSESQIAKIVAAEWEMGGFDAQRKSLGDQLAAIQTAGTAHGESAAAFAATAGALKAEGPSQDERKKVAREKLEGLHKNTPGHSAECFTCGQHLSEEDAQRLIAEQEAEIASADARISELRELIKKAQTDATVAQAAAQASRNDWNNTNAQLTALVSRESSLRALVESKGGYEATLATADADLLTLDTELDSAKAEVETHHSPSAEEVTLQADLSLAEANAADEANAVRARRDALQQQQTSHLVRVRAFDNEKFRRDEHRKQEADLIARLEAIQDERAVAAKHKQTYGMLAKAFSPTGIPAMILTGVVEEIGAEVNIALETLSGGQLSVDIRANKETRGGGSQQKITIYVDAPDGTRAYETLSGGQRFRVDLAIRVGLNKVISRRTGTPMLTFIIDEGWGTLDEAGVLSAVDTMERLSKDLCVLTVSHIDAVKNAFPTAFEVSLEGGTSVVKTVTQ